jgi:hypothetical protein
MKSLRRAWMFGLALGCGPQPPAMTSSTSATTGEGTTTSTVTTSTSTGAPTEGGSQTTDDSAGSSGSGAPFIMQVDGGGCSFSCDCPEDKICVAAPGIECPIDACALPPAGCDPADLCSQACATACFAAPPLPDGCERGQPPPWWVHCSYDYGGPCTPWAENCPDGEKCVVNQFGSMCAPVDPQPIPVGELCEVALESDPCVAGALCSATDPETGMPVCEETCKGTAEQPVCPDGDGCRYAYWQEPALCLPVCDPLGPPCADGAVCVPGLTGFVCVAQLSVLPGDLHTACSVPEHCDAGLTCFMPGCLDGTRCCTPYCDLGAPTCPPDHTCVPLPWPGDAPSGWAHVGVCAGK